MKSVASRRSLLWAVMQACLVLMLLAWPTWPAGAQSAIGGIAVTREVDARNFPNIQVHLRVTDTAGQPITRLGPGDLVVTEDNRPVGRFSVDPVDVGVQVVFVLHPGSNMVAAGLSGQPRVEEAREAIRYWISNYMREGLDSVAVVAQSGGQSQVLQSLTTQGALALAAVDSYPSEPPVSPGLVPAVEAAVSELDRSVSNVEAFKAIVVLSVGWEEGGAATIREVANLVTSKAIQLNFVQVRRDQDFSDGYRSVLAAANPGDLGRKGTLVSYKSAQSLDRLYRQLAGQRLQYTLTFRTAIAGSARHTIAVAPNAPASGSWPTVQYQPPASQPAALTFTNLQPQFVILRHASENVQDPASIPPTFQTVAVEIGLPYPGLKVDQAELLVNGVSLGSQTGPGSTFEWTWQLTEYTVYYSMTTPNIADTALTLRVTDDLGQQYEEVINGQVSFFNPEPDLLAGPDVCANLLGLPYVGSPLATVCHQYGITPPIMLQFALLGATVVAVIVLWFNRGKVVAVSSAVAARATAVYRRLTKQTGGGEVKAALIALQGLEQSSRTEFEIFGETPIGRNPEKAVLTFHIERENSPVSGLHCTIHEEDLAGSWSIEDEDSSNGTFLNGKRLPGFGHRMPLTPGDVLELGQVERGGIKFRFESRVGASALGGGVNETVYAVSPGAGGDGRQTDIFERPDHVGDDLDSYKQAAPPAGAYAAPDDGRKTKIFQTPAGAGADPDEGRLTKYSSSSARGGDDLDDFDPNQPDR